MQTKEPVKPPNRLQSHWLLALFGFLFLISACSQDLTTGSLQLQQKEFQGLKFDDSVLISQKELLDLDMERLRQISVTDVSTADLASIGLTQFEGPELVSWVEDRIKYVVGENFSYSTLAKFEGSLNYPKGQTNQISLGQQSSLEDLLGQSSTVTIMMNLGGLLYSQGKLQSKLVSIPVAGEKIFINSPRVGVVQIGEGLFTSWAVEGTPKNSVANSLLRLSTLIHEARHSDGNGDNATFPHARCPLGHELAGNYACDNKSNGPYVLNALTLKHFLKTCTNCTNIEKQTIMLFQSDSLSRILPGATDGDTSPEQVEFSSSAYHKEDSTPFIFSVEPPSNPGTSLPDLSTSTTLNLDDKINYSGLVAIAGNVVTPIVGDPKVLLRITNTQNTNVEGNLRLAFEDKVGFWWADLNSVKGTGINTSSALDIIFSDNSLTLRISATRAGDTLNPKIHYRVRQNGENQCLPMRCYVTFGGVKYEVPFGSQWCPAAEPDTAGICRDYMNPSSSNISVKSLGTFSVKYSDIAVLPQEN